MLGEPDCGLYKLFRSSDPMSAPLFSFTSTRDPVILSVPFPTSTSVPCRPVHNDGTINKADILWHYRLRHVSFSKLNVFPALLISYQKHNLLHVPFVL